MASTLWFGPNVPPRPAVELPKFDYSTVPVREAGVDFIRLLEILPSPGSTLPSSFGYWVQPSWPFSAPQVRYTTQDALTCRMIKVPLRDSMPPYAALSYSWGPRLPSATIICNGMALDIQPSLLTALTALKNDHPAVLWSAGCYIWADGACINQENSEAAKAEKSHQLPLMVEIYRRAQHVIVWLGKEHALPEPAPRPAFPTPFPTHLSPLQPFFPAMAFPSGPPTDIDHAMPCIRKCANAMRTCPRALAPTMSMLDWQFLGFQSEAELKLQLRAFFKLLERDWFKRAWTVQEHAVARSVLILCGRHQIHEADLMNAGTFLAASGTDTLIGGWAGNPLIDMYGIKSEQNAGAKPPLLHLLAHFRHRDASNAMDKINAVCGLACDSGPGALDIKPGVGESPEDKAEFYRTVAIKLLEAYHNLDVVSLAGRYTVAVDPKDRKRKPLELPSWVPNWSLPDATTSIQLFESKRTLRGPGSQSLGYLSGHYDRQPTYMFPLDADPTVFRAAGDTKYDLQMAAGGWGLRVRGICLGEIASIGKWADEFVQSPARWWEDEPDSTHLSLSLRVLKRLCSWLDISRAESGGFYNQTSEPLMEVFWQTMRCGHFPQGFARERQCFADFYNANLAVLDFYRTIATQPDDVKLSQLGEFSKRHDEVASAVPSTSFQARVAQHVKNRGMCITKSGLIGLVPRGSEEEDKIYILEGGAVPFVMRSTPDDGSWEIIGACYVHGAMHGEMCVSKTWQSMVVV